MNVLEELDLFYENFGGEKGIIGETELGKPIYFLAVRKTARPVIIAQYSIHAREYICTYLAMAQAKDFLESGTRGTVFFIPAANPDGINIALTKNPLYKANARGVDLNVNFDARWGTGEKNVFKAGTENFVGEKPFSEKETRALREFTLAKKPNLTISYHSKGEEIYWEFRQNWREAQRDYKIAKAISLCTGYPLKSAGNSAGGYKDWCIEKLKIPALTIEVGRDELFHPIGKESLAEIYEKNKNVLKTAVRILGKQRYSERVKSFNKDKGF